MVKFPIHLHLVSYQFLSDLSNYITTVDQCSNVMDRLNKWVQWKVFVDILRARVQIPATSPLQQYVGTGLAAMLAAKRTAHVAPEVDLGECTLHSPPQKK